MSNRVLQFRLEAARPDMAVDARDFRDFVSAALDCLARLEKSSDLQYRWRIRLLVWSSAARA